MAPRITQELGVEWFENLGESRQVQQIRSLRHQQSDGKLHWGHRLLEIQARQFTQQIEIAIQRRPRRERDKGGRERNAVGTAQHQYALEISASMVFIEIAQDPIVHRFDGRGDEQAATLAQHRQQHGVVEQVLNFDGGVERQLRKAHVHGLHHLERVSRPVEKIRVAE